MVARNSDSPRGVNERLRDQSKKHDELVRSVGRGTSALRDASDNVLEMSPSSTSPMLVDEKRDLAINFANTNNLEIVSANGANYRGLAAGPISSDGTISATGWVDATDGVNATNGDVIGNQIRSRNALWGNQLNLGAGPVYAGGGNFTGLTVNGGALIQNGLTVNATVTHGQLNMGVSAIYCGVIHHQGLVGPSDAMAKRNITEVSAQDVDMILNAPVKEWEYLPNPNLDPEDVPQRQVGPLAHDMPSVALRTIPEDSRRHIDMQTHIGLLQAALQRSHSRVESLESEVFELRCKLDDLVETVRLMNES